MDALTTTNLKDTLRLEKKRDSTTEKDWDKMNRTVCGLIKSCLTQDIKYHVLRENGVATRVDDVYMREKYHMYIR